MRIIELGFDRLLVSRLYDSFGKTKLLFWKQLKGSDRKQGNFRLLRFFKVHKQLISADANFEDKKPNVHFAEIANWRWRS